MLYYATFISLLPQGIQAAEEAPVCLNRLN